MTIELKLPEIHIELPLLENLRNGYMRPGDTEAIVALLNNIGARRVVEFGLNEGKTARELLRFVPTIENYVGIDVQPGYKPVLIWQKLEIPTTADFVGRYVKDDPRVRILTRPNGSADIDPSDIGRVDAALIDGDHSHAGVLRDVALAHACVRPGGVIMHHDYHAECKVDVPAALHDLADRGHPLEHVAGTWIAFEVVGDRITPASWPKADAAVG